MFIENRYSITTFIPFYLNLTIWFSCLKLWVDPSWKDKGGYLCQAWRNVRGVLSSLVMKHDGEGWVGQIREILVWGNYWTVPWFLLVSVIEERYKQVLPLRKKKSLLGTINSRLCNFRIVPRRYFRFRGSYKQPREKARKIVSNHVKLRDFL